MQVTVASGRLLQGGLPNVTALTNVDPLTAVTLKVNWTVSPAGTFGGVVGLDTVMF